MVALGVLGWAVIVVLQHFLPDPEAENVTDYQDLPEFLASTPELTRPGAHRVQEHNRGSDANPGDRTPYFIQFADGRYACGYTDDAGNTKPVFTDQAVAHEVFWDQQAWARWLAVAKPPAR